MKTIYLALQLSIFTLTTSITNINSGSSNNRSDNKLKSQAYQIFNSQGNMNLEECFLNAAKITANSLERQTCNKLLYKQYASSYMYPNTSVIRKNKEKLVSSDSQSMETLMQIAMDLVEGRRLKKYKIIKIMSQKIIQKETGNVISKIRMHRLDI